MFAVAIFVVGDVDDPADAVAATGGPDFERLIELEVADTGRPEEEKEDE